MNLSNKYEKFFFYPQKIFTDNAEEHENIVEQLIDDCERLTRQCDELKVNNLSKCIIYSNSSSYYHNRKRRKYQVQRQFNHFSMTSLF